MKLGFPSSMVVSSEAIAEVRVMINKAASKPSYLL